ncbi:MAG: hypothetical protein OHK006_21840 [Thermodesulfovibrionales bacterium]
MALEGSLQDFGLADILQLVCFQRKTGILTLEGKLDRVRILFIDGSVVGAESKRRMEDNRLGKVLVKKNIINDEDLQAALEEQRRTGVKLGAVLIRKGLVKREAIQEILAGQVTETVVQLFSWKQGTYEFTAQGVPQDKDIQLVIDTQHLLMDGLRIVDELSIIKDRISLDSVFRMQGPKPDGLSEEEAEIYGYVDGENDVSSIIDLSGRDNYEVSKTLVALLDKGVIEPVQVAPVVAAAAPEKVPSAAQRGWFGYLPWLALCLSIVIAMMAVALRNEGNWPRLSAAKEIADFRFRIEKYRLEKGAYPASLGDIGGAEDPWGSAFVYRGAEDSFSLFSAGPDGKPGTQDDLF